MSQVCRLAAYIVFDQSVIGVVGLHVFLHMSLSFVTCFAVVNKIEDILEGFVALVKSKLFSVFWSCFAAAYGIRLP
jgi:hypothetical protein